MQHRRAGVAAVRERAFDDGRDRDRVVALLERPVVRAGRL
jgi:hypothetical protein